MSFTLSLHRAFVADHFHDLPGFQEDRHGHNWEVEAAVVQDADRLEALGAIGVARVFATGGSFNAGLWHPLDPFARNRDLNDKAWTLDHFEKKLLKLPGLMKTATGRRLAEPRLRTMEAYLQALRIEIDVEFRGN